MADPDARMSLMDAIQARRSVRSYAPRRLDQPAIRALLAAAVRAPTALHQEPWSFVVVQDADRLKRLSDRAKRFFAEEARRTHLDRGGHALDKFEGPEFNIFYDAGTLIVVCANPAAPFVSADCWLAAGNLMLAAVSMGLGTCVIGSAILGLNSPETKSELGIPSELSAIAPVIVGVPAAALTPTSRKEPRILAWK